MRVFFSGTPHTLRLLRECSPHVDVTQYVTGNVNILQHFQSLCALYAPHYREHTSLVSRIMCEREGVVDVTSSDLDAMSLDVSNADVIVLEITSEKVCIDKTTGEVQQEFIEDAERYVYDTWRLEDIHRCMKNLCDCIFSHPQTPKPVYVFSDIPWLSFTYFDNYSITVFHIPTSAQQLLDSLFLPLKKELQCPIQNSSHRVSNIPIDISSLMFTACTLYDDILGVTLYDIPFHKKKLESHPIPPILTSIMSSLPKQFQGWSLTRASVVQSSKHLLIPNANTPLWPTSIRCVIQLSDEATDVECERKCSMCFRDVTQYRKGSCYWMPAWAPFKPLPLSVDLSQSYTLHFLVLELVNTKLMNGQTQ